MSIEQIFINTSLSQRITERDWHNLNALSKSNLSPEERQMIQRIKHSIRRGWFSILNGEPGPVHNGLSQSI